MTTTCAVLALACQLSLSVAALEPVTEAIAEDVYVTSAVLSKQPWQNSAGAADVIDTQRQLPGLGFDVADIFNGLPGVQADSRSNFAQDTRLTLRGFGARSAFGVRGIDMRLDAIPLTMPDGQSQTSVFMTDTLAAVEVLRGPMAVLYGNSAGGVISLRPLVPEQTGVEVMAGGGPDGQRRYRLRGELKAGDHAARVQASMFEADGFRPHSAASREQIGAEWFYSPGDLDVRARVDISRDPDSADPQGLTLSQWRENPAQTHAAAERFDTRKNVDHRQASLSVARDHDMGSWQLATWAGERKIEQKLAFPGSDISAGGGMIALDKTFAGANTRVTRHLGPVALTLGGEFELMRDARTGFVNEFGARGDLRRDEAGRVESLDAFSGLLWQMAERWQLQAGARYNRINMKVDDHFIVPGNPDDSGRLEYTEPTYALGLNYGEGAWRWFASVGRGFETPTLTELAYRNEGTGLNDLSAANNRQAETGWRYQSGNLTASLVFYHINSENELVVDRSEGGRTTYRNAAGTRRTGVEWFSLWQPVEVVRWRIGGNLIDARYDEGPFDGQRLPGVAKASLYSQWDWLPWADERFAVNLAGQYRSRTATGDDNSEFAPAATLWSLGVSGEQPMGNTTLGAWLKVENLTDKSAVGAVIVNQGAGRTLEPLPGRQVHLGVSWRHAW